MKIKNKEAHCFSFRVHLLSVVSHTADQPTAPNEKSRRTLTTTLCREPVVLTNREIFDEL